MKYLKGLSLVLIIFLVVSCGNKKYLNLEEQLVKLASEHYEEHLKDSYPNMLNFNVTLENLKNTGADVQKFVDADCEDDSYALVSLKKDDNGEKTGDYDIEVHLNCKNYKSEENK